MAPAITRWPSLKPVTAEPSFSNDAHRLVADGEAGTNRILALQDVNVSAANRRGGDPHQRVERPDVRDRLLLQHDPTPLDEYRGFHFRHHVAP